jgi:hypothetical protein
MSQIGDFIGSFSPGGGSFDGCLSCFDGHGLYDASPDKQRSQAAFVERSCVQALPAGCAMRSIP